MSTNAASLGDRIKQLLTNSADDADVHFLVGKGDEKELMSAHKLILKTASEVFSAMFRFDSKNTEAKNVIGSIVAPVKIIDVEADAFRAMLKFIYSDDLTGLSEDNLFDVLYAAEKYQITELVKACMEFPVSKLSNVFEMLLKARLIDANDFARHCLDYIDQNAEVLFTSNAFLQIDQNLLCELLGRDQLKMNGEMSLWKAALCWADEQCRRNGIDCSAENRRKMLGPALFQIRFPIIPKEDFLQSIVPSGVLTKDDMFSVLLHHCQSPDQHQELAGLYPLRYGTKQRAKLLTATEDEPQEEEKQEQQQQPQPFFNGSISYIRHECNKIAIGMKKMKEDKMMPGFRHFVLFYFFTLLLFSPLLMGFPLQYWHLLIVVFPLGGAVYFTCVMFLARLFWAFIFEDFDNWMRKKQKND